ncbi:MAG: hypothetical protein A2086_01440 [Spirochaetes bacterium GWD1_27_9]|nr:MAG: hypothetical protein A2Z98_01830 [Spirochaetes bacterium GWB1_27_13]OHD24414.1 MAG: hypothetical protein A2Y34_04185 [Spirochaetes bacterium GWC1_27_15]OHD36939.1 MAG: hypothetical protein A2086_01440 [Spirochaetes bacterium GWD1_27_9]
MVAESIFKQKHILVIDDDPIILKSIQNQLKSQSFQLEIVNDPKEALRIAFEKEFDLVICDVKMEPINGLEILQKIKSYRPGLPVIILTGYVDDQIRQKAKEIGSSDFLIKPVRKQQLIDAINNVKQIY